MVKRAGVIKSFVTFGLLLLPLLLQGPASAQHRRGAGRSQGAVFRPVPQNLRTELIKRLNLYVLLRRNHQWGELYDLYSQRHIARRFPPSGMSREEFRRGNEQDDLVGRGDNLLRFEAQKVRFTPAGEELPASAFIEGCGEYYATKAGRRVGPSRKVKSVAEAIYTNGKWYLSDVVVNYRCEDCEADKCRMNQRRGPVRSTGHRRRPPNRGRSDSLRRRADGK